MRPSRLLVLLSPLGFTACLSGSETITTNRGTPIDCATLATGLDAAAPTLTTVDSTGLKYRDQTVGTGPTVSTGMTVRVHYSGCLTSGTKFDENTDVDPPLQFVVGDTAYIKGFSQGLVGAKVGGRRQLVIPPALAYGAAGASPAIPPNATLVFTIDLIAAQ